MNYQLKETPSLKRIASTKNERVKEWKKLQSRKKREERGLFLIEGLHLIEEALKYKSIVQELIVLDGAKLPNHFFEGTIPTTIVSKEVFSLLSETDSPQGVMAVCKQLRWEIDLNAKKWLLIDAVQDPGNLGTIIRTADAAGMDVVILGEGTVDLYNSKTIRATQGSIFHLPVVNSSLKQIINKLKEEKIPVFGTSTKNAVFYKEIPPSETFALLVGNEGNGVSKELLDMTDQNLHIPIYGKAESLNVAVASAIFMYHLRK